MDSEEDIFSLAGPLHLNTVDWKNTDHRREVAACLVQGACVLVRDRQNKRIGTNALAPPWWEFFNFEYSPLVDDVDGSIFGVIYKLKTPVEGAPTYVIAFRGTNKGKSSFIRDFKLNLKLIRHKLHRTSRYEIAMQNVQDIVAAAGWSNVWLAGHSLGAAIGMLVGKNMAREGTFLEAFLFNPPFNSVFSVFEIIKNEKLKHKMRTVGSFITAGATVVVKGRHPRISQSEDPFVALSAWVPIIFVNPADPICSEYIGYFVHRRAMEDKGFGTIENLATQNSLRSLCKTAIGRGSVDSVPLHLLPSANLTINRHPSPAHGIRQWWAPDLHLDSKEYKYCSSGP